VKGVAAGAGGDVAEAEEGLEANWADREWHLPVSDLMSLAYSNAFTTLEFDFQAYSFRLTECGDA
jgi:hypothetical protein